MSFLQPLFKYPDVGQGVSDLVMQFIQMMMMKNTWARWRGQKAGAGKGNGAPTSVGAGMADQPHSSPTTPVRLQTRHHPIAEGPGLPAPQRLDINLLIELSKNST